MKPTIFYCKMATFSTILCEALCGADVCKANSQQQIASNLRRFLLEKATRRRHATSALAHEVALASLRQIKIRTKQKNISLSADWEMFSIYIQVLQQA